MSTQQGTTVGIDALVIRYQTRIQASTGPSPPAPCKSCKSADEQPFQRVEGGDGGTRLDANVDMAALSGDPKWVSAGLIEIRELHQAGL